MFFLIGVALFVVYCVGLAIYRLFLSPLAKFPGPILPALTWWYEFYYEIIRPNDYFNQIERLHAAYGPIVRINPGEIHIKDPDWYGELNAGSAKVRNKSDWFIPNGGTSGFGTADHYHHRKRRAVLNPFFSKQAVMNLEPMVLDKVEFFCRTMEEAHANREIVEMNDALTGLTLDIVSHYSFGKPMGLIGNPGKCREWRQTLMSALEGNTIGRHFPLIPKLLDVLPDSVGSSISEPVAFFIKWKNGMKTLIEDTFAREKPTSEFNGHNSLFEELRDSALPPEEKTMTRLMDEASSVIAAGGETTAKTLANLTYYLCVTPDVLQKLRAELDAAFSDPQNPPNLQKLEQLPYLKATVTESHRISSVLTTRFIRTAPKEVLHYNDWSIPAGTPVSMTTHWTHYDPLIFPSPYEFKPERFLGDSQEARDAERYVVPFGKGTRACLGLNLAQAELVLTIAQLFRKIDFELYDTTIDDVKSVRDTFTGRARTDSKGIRVKVVGVRG